MKGSATDELVKALIENVRDRAIDSCEVLLSETARGQRAARWRASAVGGRADPHRMIADCVDDVVFHVLDAIDNDLVPLRAVVTDGVVGTLAGC